MMVRRGWKGKFNTSRHGYKLLGKRYVRDCENIHTNESSDTIGQYQVQGDNSIEKNYLLKCTCFRIAYTMIKKCN